MAAFFQSLHRTIAAGVALAIVAVILVGLLKGGEFVAINKGWVGFLLRWLHVISGVMWIGLLWYFNFVQTPSMPKIPDDQKPAVSKVIAPTALFWFRWAAAATVVTGVLVALMGEFFVKALFFTDAKTYAGIGVGMWLALIMAFNVWFIIWPNQQKALGLVDVPAEEKPKAARIAGMTSRINTMLSIPMLYCMVGQTHAGF